ncbi:MAG: hypothetical protein FJZ56_02845 [Chlamydiae bacterium]|nr:hypothetical protein [Chlamydiota bacterium]
MLHLLPNFLAEDTDAKKIFPPSIYEVFPTLDVLIVETPKEARAYLKRLLASDPELYKRLLSLPMKEYNEHTTDKEISELLEKSKNFAYLSDAGLPCIADPGYKLVKLAKDLGIEVMAHIGPSSVILALMLSGMNAASFTFYGNF